MGYGAFPLGMIQYLWRAKQPYNVSVAAEVAAVAALSNLDYMQVGGSGEGRRLGALGALGALCMYGLAWSAGSGQGRALS